MSGEAEYQRWLHSGSARKKAASENGKLVASLLAENAELNEQIGTLKAEVAKLKADASTAARRATDSMTHFQQSRFNC